VPGGELRLVMALPGVRTHHAPDPNAADERKTALQASPVGPRGVGIQHQHNLSRQYKHTHTKARTCTLTYTQDRNLTHTDTQAQRHTHIKTRTTSPILHDT